MFKEAVKREQEIIRLKDEISRLTENQRLQDSATAAVMERAERAEAELAEQCRLHAMGSEREARLTARVAELKAALRQASLCIREHVPVGNDRGFTLTIINAALNAARGTE